MIWMISKLYDGQFGEVIGSTGRSRKFNITGGVRQGCVLSPRLFCAVLQFAMRKWRMKVGDLGFDLSDGMPHLIDLRFADGILLFARSAMELRKVLDSLVAELSEVGFLLNADKTVILTSQSQLPSTITIDHGVTLKVLPGNVAQIWLGCMLAAYGSEQNFWTCNSISNKRQKRIMPTNGFWKTGRFPFRSVFGILMLLFHRLRVLQVGIVPFTRNIYKFWISTFVNSADPSWGLRRTLTGHLNGMRFCTLGTNVQHILLASQRYRVGPEFAVVRIGNWLLTLPNFPFIIGYREFCIGNLWGQGGLGGQNTDGTANCRCIVASKDWVAGRTLRRTLRCGSNN